MNRESKINLNRFGQNIIDNSQLIIDFEQLDYESKKMFLQEFVYYFLTQSKPNNDDVEQAIINSALKPTYTCCVLLRKDGVETHNFEKIISLPNNELTKSYSLLLHLYKIAYNRNFEIEKNDPNKWWYWDLTDEQNIKLLEGKTI